MYDGTIELYQKIILIFYSCFSLSSHDLSLSVFLCLSLTFLSFSLFSTINGAPPWSSTVNRIGGEMEKHQATNEKRDEKGRLRVKTVWVKFWICDLCIQICSDWFCSDVGSVFCSDGLLKIVADDGFCVCFAVRHGLMSFVYVLW